MSMPGVTAKLQEIRAGTIPSGAMVALKLAEIRAATGAFGSGDINVIARPRPKAA